MALNAHGQAPDAQPQGGARARRQGESPAGPGQVLLSREGRVATVTLSHPGRLNAISVAMWRELGRVFATLSDDDSLRCVVLKGQDGNFAAGADISEFPRERGNLESVLHYHTQIIAPSLAAVSQCIHPVIACIEGVCVGGGLELASQCDLRIAEASSRFGVPINRLGFPMAPDEMRGLLALAGRAVTMEILLEGRVFNAAEAMAKGLLTRVVPDGEAAGDAARVARRLEHGAPLAARINKRTAARLVSDARPLDHNELAGFFSYADSRDHREGVEAFLAGRAPVFTGE